LATVTRRDLLAAIGAGWLVDASVPSARQFTGRIVGANHRVGHLLRDGASLVPDGEPERADIVVVGSGVSGASAAWRLGGAGIEVLMLELEAFPGGTSAWSEDGVVPHPWGAHYLPAPNPSARATLRLLEELGAVTGYANDGAPTFREELLCHAPDERLFFRGEWHPSLVPLAALDAGERAEFERFQQVRARLRDLVGRDGKPAFTIPLVGSSRDPELLALDRMTMAAWLEREGFRSPFLRWYVEYATLDDFGSTLDDVSAWAGLHYFAARKLETEQLRGSHYLVWPEGNGRLVRHLLDKMHGRREARALVLAIEPRPGDVIVHALDLSGDRPRRRTIRARGVVLAVPGFVARRLLPPALAARVVRRTASPWLVANLHVKRPLEPNRAWDSVLYRGAGLGYVDSGHQRTEPREDTIFTYFRAFGDADVEGTRARLVSERWASLAADVLLDLAPAHPDLAETTSRLDVMVWGHAMPRPRPGFLTEDGVAPFEPTPLLDARVAWAHVDRTGYALFEEANAHGVRAAEALAENLSAEIGASWL